MALYTHSRLTKPTSAKSIARSWHLVDARGMVIGKLATKVASLLQGKHKRGYSSNLDNGDIVVIVNAGKVVSTGKKHIQKVYTRYSGYPGGLRQTTLERMMIKNPREVVRRAISGMLPKNKLRRKRLARLHIFTDSAHPYSQYFTSLN